MTTKKDLELVLIVRLAAKREDNLYRDFNTILQTLNETELGRDVPVHWNFPCLPLLSSESGKADFVFRELRGRMEESLDMIIPMGFAGAYHSLLTENELRKEIEWARSNPWGSGFDEVIPGERDLMMPAQMDFLRTFSRNLYTDKEITWLVYPLQMGEIKENKIELEDLEIYDQGNICTLPLLRLPVTEALIPRILKKVVRKQIGQLGVVIDCTLGSIEEGAIELFETVSRLSSKHAIDFVRISKWLAPDNLGRLNHNGKILEISATRRIPGSPLPLPSYYHGPADRFPRAEGAQKRFLLKENENLSTKESIIRTILWKNALHKRSEAAESKEPRRPRQTPVERSLIADMPGTVLLKEHTFEAQFINGRFTDILNSRGAFLAGEPAKSYLCTSDLCFTFDDAGAYSFENENIRGLREILQLETPLSLGGSRLVADYLFIGEFPCLFISVDIEYPVFHEPMVLTSYAPMEIPLFYLDHDEHVACSGSYPDGSYYRVNIPAVEGVYDLSGTGFLFTKGNSSFSLLFPPIGEYSVETLPVKMKNMKGRVLFSINPKGSYTDTNSRTVSGYTEHFTLMVAAGTGEELENGAIPHQVLVGLQRPWIGQKRP